MSVDGRFDGDDPADAVDPADPADAVEVLGAVEPVEAVEVLDAVEPVDAVEVLDAMPAIADVRRLEPAHPPAVVALAQTAAVAATGFVAGIATAAMLGRRRQRRRGLPAAKRPQAALEVASSRSYLVHVQALERRG